jgi:hypothetical protein
VAAQGCGGHQVEQRHLVRAALAAAQLPVHGLAFEHLHGARCGIELCRIHRDEGAGRFDLGQQRQPDGAAVAQAHPVCPGQPGQGLHGQRARRIVTEQDIAESQHERAVGRRQDGAHGASAVGLQLTLGVGLGTEFDVKQTYPLG